MSVPEDLESPLPSVPTLPSLLLLANRFEQAWDAAGSSLPPPDLAAYLPPSDDARRLGTLQDLVRIDLAMRWRRGLPRLLESYLQQFPELGAAASLPVELIYHEYRLRWRHGDHPLLDDYQKRFPNQYRRLLALAKGKEEQSAARFGVSSLGEMETSAPESEVSPLADAGKKSGEVPLPAAAPANDDKSVVPLVGGYRLLKRLGAGALGEVWKAEAPGGVEVAVKRLSRTLEAHEAQYELRSLEHVKRLRHNFLMPIHAFWVHKRRLYVAMELADGSLSDRAESYRAQGLPGIPREELLRYVRESAEALDFLHSEGIHHRDIKPANILLLKGHVKVADFGLVRPLSVGQSEVNATFCGTPTYMPPEVWNNKLSVHSDQWSLAVSYLELRFNRRVFKSRNTPSLMNEICKGQVDLTPLEKAERPVLQRALHPDPRQRYPNCTAFAQALEAAAHPVTPPRRRLPAPLVVLFAGLAAVGLFLSLYLFWSSPRPARIHAKAVIPRREVVTGGDVFFRLFFQRENYDGSFPLVAEQLPQEVKIEAEAQAGEDFASVSVHVEPGAKPGSHRVHLRTADDNLEGKFAFDLTVLYLPPGFEPIGLETDEDDLHVKYYKQLRRRLNEKSSIEFVLIAQREKDWKAGAGKQDPRTFYISRFKISREQFCWFAESGSGKLIDDKWKSHADDKGMPVFDVAFTDAHAFASYLGGRLPSPLEWDKAAGRYHPARGREPYWEGPYKGRWKGKGSLQIAVGSSTPYPVGSSKTETDGSVYGCRDMAGNGEEWTRRMRSGEDAPLDKVEVGFDEDLCLRGWDFKNEKPLRFDKLDEEERQKLTRYKPYKDTADNLGFRVVLEPNR
jgi:serine/threonine protein kinase